MILITGATGKIGKSLVEQLASCGEHLRALARRLPRDKTGGIEWVSADLANRDDLVLSFKGVAKLFLLTANGEDMVQLQKNAIEAARIAGVQHIVKLSALGASDHSLSLIGVWHYSIETVLKASGLAWTTLRPHHFMDNLLDQRENIVRDGLVYSASGEGKIPFIDTRDIAAVAAAALTETGHEGKTYNLTGPEAISYRRATEILSDSIGRALTYVPETEDQAWIRLRHAGEPAWRIAAQLAISAYQLAGGPTERVTTAVQEVLGRPPRSFADFATDHAAFFPQPK